MKEYTLNDIQNMLDFFEIKKSDIVLMHSSLFTLGKIKDIESKNIAKYFTQVIKKHLEKDGAFLVPSFSYSFPQTKQIDLGLANSEMGILSNYLINLKESYRSNHPMFSITGIGSKAKELLQPEKKEVNPFSQDSTYNRLTEKNGIILIVGSPLVVATYIVYCEFMLGVKYRFLKPFEGLVTNSKTSFYSFDKFYHFVWPSLKNYDHIYEKFHQKMLDNSVTKCYHLGKGKVYGFRANLFYQEVENFLHKTPFGLISEPPNAFYEFKNGKEVIKSK